MICGYVRMAFLLNMFLRKSNHYVETFLKEQTIKFDLKKKKQRGKAPLHTFSRTKNRFSIVRK